MVGLTRQGNLVRGRLELLACANPERTVVRVERGKVPAKTLRVSGSRDVPFHRETCPSDREPTIRGLWGLLVQVGNDLYCTTAQWAAGTQKNRERELGLDRRETG